jgi:hypothetical protein
MSIPDETKMEWRKEYIGKLSALLEEQKATNILLVQLVEAVRNADAVFKQRRDHNFDKY